MFTHSKFANWKIFLLEECLLTLVHFWGEESSIEGWEESAAHFPFALQFITRSPHYTIPDCYDLRSNKRKRVCWLDNRQSTDHFLLARRLLSVKLPPVRYWLICVLSVLYFYHHIGNLNTFSHLKLILFSCIFGLSPPSSRFSLIQTESCPIKSGIARLYCNKIVHPNPKNLNRLLQHCFMWLIKFCTRSFVKIYSTLNHGPLRLSMFEISKVPPTPTLLCSGGNLRTIIVSNLA